MKYNNITHNSIYRINEIDDLTTRINKIIISKQNYMNVVISMLNEIYSFDKNIQTKQLNGLKNKINIFEYEIENIIKKYCILINKNDIILTNQLCYKHQPYGSQSPPDYIIYFNDKIIKIECKSSKTLKPVWNCSIPDNDTIYLFYTHKLNKTFVFLSNDLISQDKYREIVKFHTMIKKLSKEFNETILKNEKIEYYPRQMINQIINFNVEKRNIYFDNVKNKINLNKLEK